jgi:predicted small metal-binding protein
MKELFCGSIVPGCDWHGRAETEAELLRKVAEHARTAHGIEDISPNLLASVRSKIVESDAPSVNGSGAGSG